MRKRMLSFAAILLIPASCAGERQDRWGAGSGPDFCAASRESEDEPLGVILGEAGASGIALFAPALADFSAGVEYRDVALRIDGAPVRARAFGALFRERGGIEFNFDVRRVVRRNPNGFTLSVHRGDSRIYETRVGESAKAALGTLLECDRTRRVARGRA